MKYFMILRTKTTRIFIIYVIYTRKYLTLVRITRSCSFVEFSFLTKGLIYPISVGMERFNGIPVEIFCLVLTRCKFI